MAECTIALLISLGLLFLLIQVLARFWLDLMSLLQGCGSWRYEPEYRSEGLSWAFFCVFGCALCGSSSSLLAAARPTWLQSNLKNALQRFIVLQPPVQPVGPEGKATLGYYPTCTSLDIQIIQKLVNNVVGVLESHGALTLQRDTPVKSCAKWATMLCPAKGCVLRGLLVRYFQISGNSDVGGGGKARPKERQDFFFFTFLPVPRDEQDLYDNKNYYNILFFLNLQPCRRFDSHARVQDGRRETHLKIPTRELTKKLPLGLRLHGASNPQRVMFSG